MYDVVIIGAGVIGGLVARQLTKKKISVAILEKEGDVACGASKANSGIIHGGYDPIPGTLKAELNTSGVSKLYKVAKELNVPFVNNGSMVCAFGDEDDKAVKKLYLRGKQNGIQAISIISGDRARQVEPRLSNDVTSVLFVENAGIISPYELTIAAVGNAMDNGATLFLDFEVTRISKGDNIFTVTAVSGKSVKGKYLINCAGACADDIAALAGDGFFSIIPRAGEYILLDKKEGGIKHTVFQVPGKEGKGILVTPTVDGNILTGPTAAVCKKDDTATSLSAMETVKAFAKKSIPDIDFSKRITSFCGIRASEKNGDFIISQSNKVKGLINVAAIDSPGLTCSAAIAEYVDEILCCIGLHAEPNPDFNGTREDMHAFSKMTLEQKDNYIKKHPDYGKIVCRCEKISQGEILAVIRKNPVARDVDGVKRRIRAGMGRCQGGFCSHQVIHMLATEQRVAKTNITQKGGDSFMVTGKVGERK